MRLTLVEGERFEWLEWHDGINIKTRYAVWNRRFIVQKIIENEWEKTNLEKLLSCSINQGLVQGSIWPVS